MITPIFLAAATVLLSDGSPASGASAVSLAKEHFAHVTGTEFARPVEPVPVAEDGMLDVTAETAGRWIILHEMGWADTSIAPDTAEVRLDPWCDVPGFVAVPHSPGALVSYHRLERPRRTEDRGSVFWTSSAPIQEDGGFTIRQVPHGHGSVGIQREEKNERRIQRWRMRDLVFEKSLFPTESPFWSTAALVSGRLPRLPSRWVQKAWNRMLSESKPQQWSLTRTICAVRKLTTEDTMPMPSRWKNSPHG